MRRTFTPERLGKRIFFGTVMLLLLSVLTAGAFYTNRLRQEVEAVALRELTIHTELVSGYISRLMYRQWSKVNVLSNTINIQDTTALCKRFKQLVQTDPLILWIGVANLSGKLLATCASDHPEGNVFNQQWFRHGLIGPYGGSVHEEPELVASLPPHRERSSTAIEFSTPVRGPDGRTIAVLGAYINWYWLQDILDSLQQEHVKYFLLSRDRKLLPKATNDAAEQAVMLAAFKASEVGPVSRLEIGQNDHASLIVILPELSYPGLPRLGWSLAARKDADYSFMHMQQLFRTFWLAIGGAVLITIAGAWVLICRNVRPLIATANFASQLAAGEYGAKPPSVGGSLENKDIALALIQLQSQLAQSRQAGAPPTPKAKASLAAVKPGDKEAERLRKER